MKSDEIDYEGVRSENLKRLIDTARHYGLWGPSMERFLYYAKQAQLEIDGDSRECIENLEDELRATKRELKIINGELSNALNNWEQERGKLDRKKRALDMKERELDERDAKIAEEISAGQVNYWKNQAEKAKADAERCHDICDRIKGCCDEL